jgi:hypothetical protein
MANTTKLILPLIAAGQAQKHVPVNESLVRLDTLTQLSVIDRDLTAPPGSPAEGDAYIPASGATGDWDDFDLNVALFTDGQWIKLTPRIGWRCWIEDEDILAVFDGADWVEITGGGGGGMTLIAIATDVKSSGTDGGGFTNGARRTRTLNTLSEAVASVVSLASNEVTLPAGTWFFRWSCPAYKTGSHKSWLRDVTNAADLATGSSEFASASDAMQSSSIGSAVAVLAGTVAVKLEHQGALTQASNGFGVATSLGSEVYSQLEVWRL